MKYIFFDIDHTLISHKNIPHIPDETREAVRLLKLSGHIPAIATGRAPFLTFLIAKELGINYLVCAGGAEIFSDGKKIFTEYFPDDALKKFLETAKIFPEITAAMDGKFLYTDGAFDYTREYFSAQAGYNCVMPLSQMGKVTTCYIMLAHEDLTSEHGIFFAPPENINLELMNNFTEAHKKGVTKWNGIKKLIAYENANLDDVITFGDGPNDADMLKNSAIGVAVGKSSEEARAAADFICGDIDEGGILKACYDLGLI